MQSTFDIESYVLKLAASMKNAFGERLAYLGLQDSYMRGEANGNSDIDIMTVICGMTVNDMDIYRDVLRNAGSYERSCGFICGKEELSCWNPLEICHLLHTTKDIHGVLAELVPAYTRDDIINYVRLSAGNLYHELCHRYIHADTQKNIGLLPRSYKQVFFILQNLYYLKKGIFCTDSRELAACLEGKDREVLETRTRLTRGESFDFDLAFELILTWCKDTLVNLQSSPRKRQ